MCQYCNSTNCSCKKLCVEKLVIKDPVTLTVPSRCYPTIQKAIDYFNGRDAMNGTIVVTPGAGSGPNGAYVESLIINKWVSSRDNFRGQGFKIIGDNRNIMGTTFLQNGIHSNAIPVAGFGTDLAVIALSNVGNVITVTLAPGPQIDFALSGLLVGDRLKVRDNAGVWTQVSVTALAGNTITHSGGALAVGTIGSAVVLVPNTELVGSINGQPTFVVENASLSFIGFWVNSDPAHGTVGRPYNNLFVYNGASVQLECCLFDNQANNLSFQNVIAYDHSSLILNRSNDVAFVNAPGINMPVTVLGAPGTGAIGYLITDTSLTIGGQLNVFNSRPAVSQVSEGTFWILQNVASSGNGFTMTDLSQALIIFGRFLQIAGSALSISRQSSLTLEGVIIDGGVIAGNSVGISSEINSVVTLFIAPATITNVQSGIRAARSGRVVVNSAASLPIFGTIGTGGNITTTYLSSYDATSAGLPGNVFSYTAAPVAMESAFENQRINTAAPINIPLTPAATASGVTFFRYLGKTYTVSLTNAAAANSTITLLAGTFVGQGGATGTVARFLGLNSSITFLVESATTVRVLQSFNMAYP